MKKQIKIDSVRYVLTTFTVCMGISGCAEKGTQPAEENRSSMKEVVFSSEKHLPPGSSSETGISSSEIPESAIALSSSNKVALSSSATSSGVSSSHQQISLMGLSSSSSLQALQFQGKEVRLPDGCSVIHWVREDQYTCVQDFWVDTVEVTVGEYQALMGGGIPSLYHNGYYLWPAESGTGYADDGTLCPNCPADGVTIYEAMLYANAMTKQHGKPEDTVYAYTAIDTIDAPGRYTKKKVKEISNLQNLMIREGKLGYRLPSLGEFHYMSLKSNLLYTPWDDIYPDSSVQWILSREVSDLFESPEYVPPPVGSKKHTTWFLHDLFGSAPEWSITHSFDYPDKYLALGNGGDAHSDIRLDSDRAGFRLVRGMVTVRTEPTR